MPLNLTIENKAVNTESTRNLNPPCLLGRYITSDKLCSSLQLGGLRLKLGGYDCRYRFHWQLHYTFTFSPFLRRNFGFRQFSCPARNHPDWRQYRRNTKSASHDFIRFSRMQMHSHKFVHNVFKDLCMFDPFRSAQQRPISILWRYWHWIWWIRRRHRIQRLECIDADLMSSAALEDRFIQRNFTLQDDSL